MTTKFSRNRAKVQPTPKVCISEKKRPPPAPPPPTYPTTIVVGFQWTASNLMMQPTQINKSLQTATGNGSGVYTWSGTDAQGRACTMTFTVVIGVPIDITVVITGYTASPPQFRATGATWNGTSPAPFNGALTPQSGVFGSGLWNLTI